MNHPSKIEDFTDDQLMYLEGLITNKCAELGVQVFGIYIVGSIVYGLDEVKDIDICVHCEKEYTRQQEAEYRSEINASTDWNIDIKFRYDWDSCTPRCDLGFLIPFYDLMNRRLMNKVPYDTIPFNFAYMRDSDGKVDTSVMVTYDRSKHFRIKKLLNITLNQR